MENLNSELDLKIDNLISCIKETEEYKNCILLQEKMKKNEKLRELIEEIKRLQKKYIKTNSEEVLENLKQQEKKLNDIPIYLDYNNNLKVVNEMLFAVKEELSNYFNNKLNNSIFF